MRRLLRSTWLALPLCVAALATHAGSPPNVATAVAAQQKLAAERPQDAGVQNDLGNLLLLAGRDADAEAAYQKALELEPQLVSARFNLALLLDRRGKTSAAQRELDRVVEAEPRHSWAWFQIGAIAERRGSRSKAIDAYAKAFSLNPDLAFAEVNPQVLDSKLVTQALLRAYRDWPGAAEAPRDYEDPARIAALLRPARPAGGAAATDTVAVETEPVPAASSRVVGAGSVTGGNAGGGSGQVVGGSRGNAGVPTGGTRDLGATTVRSWSADTEPEGDGAMGDDTAPPPPQPEPSFRVVPGGAIPPGYNNPAPGYVPNPASTGRLEYRLTPKRDRVASVTPFRG